MQAPGTIEEHARDLRAGRTTSEALVERSYARIRDPDGEGARTFIRLFEEQARAAARAADLLRAAGVAPTPLAGLPVSVKDVFDVAGSVTRAGSTVLADAAPATRDATVVARLRAAGAVVVGATNMAEFAMGVLGLNPHYGTPRNPWDRAAGRIPGGSSSGAAVSVSDGMVVAAIGTDTMGSVRIPAALCGVVGFKPTARRVPADGAIPLAPSLDSVGVLATSVADCALVDAALAGEEIAAPPPAEGEMHLGVPRTVALDALDEHVARAFADALATLARAGLRVVEIDFPELGELPPVNSKCSFHIAEGYAWHHDLLASKRDRYDPLIARRLESGAAISAKEYIDLVRLRRELIARGAVTLRSFDALLLPAVPFVAPRIDEVADEEAFRARSFLAARNTGIANLLDGCAVTLPCQRPGEPPVGLMLMREAMADARVLAVARRVEAVLAARGGA